MQRLRPLLRSFQTIGAGRVPGSPQHSSLPLPATRTHSLQYRAQHDKYGPHKEYFQTPGNEPKPDLTPYIRDYQQPQYQSLTHLPSQSNTPAGQSQHDGARDSPKSEGWPRLRSFYRSTIWFTLFLSFGWAAGTALITWEYLSPPFEPGSPEEQELVEEILETLDTHPMVEDLRMNEWIEVEVFAPDLQHGLKGRNLVHQVLGSNNTQGIFMKVFHHPAQEFTMLVFFLGFGVEGWPDMIHGGIISTLLQEGMDKHVAYYYPDYLTTADSSSNISFRKPCKPGEIYSVLVAPSGRKSTKTGNVHLTELQITSLMVQLAGAPLLNSAFDIGTNTETHTVTIPAQKGHSPTHAICRGEIKLVPKQITRNNKAFEIGGNDDGGFARALDFLKKRPEFRETQPPPSNEDKESEDEDDNDNGK